jgi:hypothetical protein
MSERSIQQLYPLGVLSGRPIALVAVGFALAYSVVMTWANRDDIVSWPVAIVAIAVLLAVGVVLGRGTRVMSPALSPRAGYLAVLLANLAFVLEAASMFGHDSRLRDDWGSMVVALVLLGLAAYRPARDIAVLGGLSALLAGFLAIVALPGTVYQAPAPLFVIVAVLPIVVVTAAVSTFVSSFVAGVERWRRRARAASSSSGAFDTAWLARSVQQDSVTVLNQDVVPFLARIAQQGTIEPDDAESARAISASIRAVLVAEMDRSWLSALIARIAPDAVVRDPQRLADRMTLDERASIRAAVTALVRHPGFRGRNADLTLVPDGERVRCSAAVELDARSGDVRQFMAPYYAVLRTTFTDFEFGYRDGTLTLGFSYGGSARGR